MSNGAEELKLTVLAKEEKRVLVITLSDIESLPYNDTWEYVTWETCSLRKWLNSTFLTKAFTKDEQSLKDRCRAGSETPACCNEDPFYPAALL